MSFANPLQLSGKQLENYKNTQKALENISNQSMQPNQGIQNQNVLARNPNPKSVSFNVDQQLLLAKGPLTPSLNLNSQDTTGGAITLPVFGSALKEGTEKEPRILDPYSKRINNDNTISQLVQQSDLTLKQVEDQFRALNFIKPVLANPRSNSRQPEYNYHGGGIGGGVGGGVGGGGGNMQQLKSEVDKLLEQVHQQKKKQITSNLDNDTRIQSYFGGGNFDQRGQSSSPTRQKRTKKREKSRNHKGRKKSKKRTSDADDTSSYSGESDSIIHERKNKYHSSDEDSSSTEERRKASKKERKKEKIRSDKKRNDDRSLSNYSKQPSQNEAKQKSPLQQLDQSSLKKLPSYVARGGREELSVYSSASQMRQQMLIADSSKNGTRKHKQPLSQISSSGFRRCPDDGELNEKEGIQNQRARDDNDDSFDINEDFQIKGRENSLGKSKERSQSKKGIHLQGFRKCGGDFDDDEEEDIQCTVSKRDGKKDQLSSKDQQNPQQLSVLSRGIQEQKRQMKQMMEDAEEDNLVFCINCEEYILMERVDDHSNLCQNSKEDKNKNQNNAIEKYNEKLIKIRFLIKNKSLHLQQNQTFNIYQKYEQILDILNICIENNMNAEYLSDAVNDVQFINAQLVKSPESSAHSLLYLSQKVIEFIRRKQQFIDRYTNQSNLQVNTADRDQLSNLDTISLASFQSNFTQQSSQRQKDPLQIFHKIDGDLQIINKNHQGERQILAQQPQQEDFQRNRSQQQQYQQKQQNQENPFQSQQQDNTLYQKNTPQKSRLDSAFQAQNNSQQGSQVQLQRQAVNVNQVNQIPRQRLQSQNPSQPFSIRPPLSQPFRAAIIPNEEIYKRQPTEERLRQPPLSHQMRPNLFQISTPNEIEQDLNKNKQMIIHPDLQRNTPQNDQFFQRNQNYIQPVQTVTVKESQISSQYKNQLPLSPIILVPSCSPYKMKSPYISQFSEESLKTQLRSKFFLIANKLKQSYSKSQHYLISDLWREASSIDLPEKDWENFFIQKFS